MYDISELTRLPNWPLVLKVAAIVGREGAPVLVGGWVRDGLLGRDSRDIDFAVAGDGIEVASRVARVLGGTLVPLDAKNGVGRVVLSASGQTIDLATYVGTMLDDLSRRDFTIDAMAVDLREGESAEIRFVDPLGGLDDLKRRVVRATGESVFAADPARLLRAVRLAVLLDFGIETQTEARIREHAALISRVAGERVREELVAFLCLPGSGRSLSYMDGLRLLTSIIPELEATRGVAQPREHYWDVLTHCLKTVEAFDFLLNQGEWPYASLSGEPLWSSEAARYFDAEVGFGSNRAALFRLAAVLHDVSKPDTKTVEPTGRIRFLGHGLEGAEVARDVLGRLRFSGREIRLVEAAVRHHLRPTQMGWPALPSRRAVYRFCRDAGEAAVGVVYLSLADHMAARGPNMDPEQWQMHVGISRSILSQREEAPARLSPLIDGYAIMKSFGLSPGRRVGELLESVREARAAGEISSRDEALALVARLLAAPASRDQNQDRPRG